MSSFADVELVVWDLDGTIIDSSQVYTECVQQVAVQAGQLPPTDEQIRHNYHGKLDESMAAVLGVTDKRRLAGMVATFLELQQDYYKDPQEHLFADAKHLAEQIDNLGIAQSVVTNREHRERGSASPRHLILHTAMARFISDIICGDEVRYNKPDIRVLDGVASAAGLQGDQIMVIGDQFVDAQLAANLGAACILVNRSHQPIAHLDRLGAATQHITQVKSLNDVIV